MSRNRQRYDRYVFGWRDWIMFLLKVSLKNLMICYLFYDSIKAFILLIPFLFLEYRRMNREKARQKIRELTLQFKDLLEALVTSLNAGYSLEHAFETAKKDLTLIYDPDAVIFPEIHTILSGLRINIPIETLLQDFGDRSQVEDIRNFANVVKAAHKTGGNLIQIIRKTTNSIVEKINVEEEIVTMFTAKRLEQKIMMIMPYGILLYLRITNGEFLEVLYHNAVGIGIMSVFVCLVYVADLWAEKIMEISV